MAGYALEIAGSAREVLSRDAPLDGLLERLRQETVSRRAWDAAAEVGWFRLLTAEAQGGLAAGPAEVAALFKEIGRHLPAGPFVETVVAAGLLRDHGDLGSESQVIAYASVPGVKVVGDTISADAGLVDFGGLATGIVLSLDAGGGALAFADLTGAGVSATPVRSFDLASRPARLRLERVPVTLIVRGDDATRAIERIERLSRVARAATLAGIAGATLDMAVAYAKERVQFDRPIGSFQAVQHRLAEMAVTRTAVESAVDAVVALVQSDGPDAQQAALYGYAAGETRTVVLSALQVHGGIGFTAEHPLHAYLKRVLRLQAIAGEGEPLLSLGRQLLAGA